MDYPAIEHRTSRPGRWLRGRRVRLALWIAVAEGLLVVFGIVPAWTALVAAAAVVSFYVLVGRRLASDAGRQASWIAALSQAVVALVPVFAFVLTALAVAALAVVAVVALVALLADRR